jgi:hypothetical protein
MPSSDIDRPLVMHCIYSERAVFDWDKNNLRKIKADRIKAGEVESTLLNDPIPIYAQDVDGKSATFITARQGLDA